ncbi:MAG: CopD family protein [Burkholderiaceae bacterium]
MYELVFPFLKLLHLLAIIVWIGGMVFAHFFLRPAALQLPPPQRLPLMHGALQRFFSAVLVAVIVVLATGLWMIGRAARETVQAGLAFNMPLDWTIMASLGIVMMAIFGHIRFALYRRLSRAVAAQDWPAGAAALASIRTWVGVNLAIGVLIVAVTLLMV